MEIQKNTGVISVGNLNPSKMCVNGKVVSCDGLARTITTEKGEGQKIYDTQNAKDYRIRKLTPRECWRLMGFTDEDFDKASGSVSNCQLYKQAGNSICVCVLEAVFSQMNIKGVKIWN
ncbi:DNA cytosine methyltransferase [Treponema pectinovorum]|uniref:DNA cytosine methyltransferase n=1 Tax=Treponema pectinovorum TaxID=164 RepID=UPI0011F14ED1|nr:DNA cytosine methyltransferase [Treponema pectinovorum]